MTRKDYEKIATALAQGRPLEGHPGFPVWIYTVGQVMMTLQADNYLFNSDRFRTACIERESLLTEDFAS